MPGQFLLQYYTDQTARKLKGIIDLDQCEQVIQPHLLYRICIMMYCRWTLD